MRFVCRFCKCYFEVTTENAREEKDMIETIQCPTMLDGIHHSLFGDLA